MPAGAAWHDRGRSCRGQRRDTSKTLLLPTSCHKTVVIASGTGGIDSRQQPLCKANVARAQRTHCRASAIDRSGNPARRPGRGHRRRCRSSPAMPLLRRAHDHCRELWVRRRTPRPAVTPTQQRQRSAMTPVTASAHLPPAGKPRFRRCIAVAPPSPKAHARILDQAKIAPSTITPASKSLLPLSCCHQPRQSAHRPPNPAHRQIPIVVDRQPGGPRVPSWEAFERRPSERPRIATTGPASETLHPADLPFER